MSMMDPNGAKEPKKSTSPTMARIAIWVIVGGVGLYLIISGVWGVIANGS
ncbi:hypothetical protein ACL9RL_03435 [Plantibacter sp. Mn2098]